ncbi:MAG: glycosyltransferase family 2 protein [Verrucomicrobiota bacterium]
MDVSVSIVTYNSASTIRACLDSVLEQAGVASEIIVVDNKSTDHTLEVLRAYGDRVRVIASPQNTGFGAGHNLAARHASASRYQLVLNPDARLTQKDGLKRLVDWMDAHPECGLCGMRIMKDGRWVPPKMHYPGARHVPLDCSPGPGEIAWVVGAGMMIRRAAFDKIGGFDEEFFLYGEETDLCLRLRKAGYAIGYNESVEVSHVGGVSEGATPTYELQLQRQQSLHRFYRKHYPPEVSRRIAERELRRSRYRLLVHSLGAKLFGQSEAARERREQYRAIVESCRRFLHEVDEGKVPPGERG